MFPPSLDGNQTSCTHFTYLADNIVELTEVFFIDLVTHIADSSKVDVVVNRARIFIADSDRVSVDFEQFSYRVSEEQEEVSVCVVLGEVVEKRLTVQIATSGGTATPHAVDFTNVDTQLTFEPRSSTRLCTTIAITNDELLEDEEYFTAHLYISDPELYIASRANSSNSSATITIVDNDQVRVSMFSNEDYVVEESAGVVSVCAKLWNATGKSVSVNVTSFPGTAQGTYIQHVPVAYMYICVLLYTVLTYVLLFSNSWH